MDTTSFFLCDNYEALRMLHEKLPDEGGRGSGVIDPCVLNLDTS
jgi:hypothetical protein